MRGPELKWRRVGKEGATAEGMTCGLHDVPLSATKWKRVERHEGFRPLGDWAKKQSPQRLASHGRMQAPCIAVRLFPSKGLFSNSPSVMSAAGMSSRFRRNIHMRPFEV